MYVNRKGGRHLRGVGISCWDRSLDLVLLYKISLRNWNDKVADYFIRIWNYSDVDFFSNAIKTTVRNESDIGKSMYFCYLYSNIWKGWDTQTLNCSSLPHKGRSLVVFLVPKKQNKNNLTNNIKTTKNLASLNIGVAFLHCPLYSLLCDYNKR